MSNRKNLIINKLTDYFAPDFLEVVDNSYLHRDHLAMQDSQSTSETHFMIKIASKKFTHQRKIEIHRQINNLLREEFACGLHALEIKIVSP